MFHGEILYQTPVDSPCDLAFLKTDPRNCRFMESVKLAQMEAVKGEWIPENLILFKRSYRLENSSYITCKICVYENTVSQKN